MLQAFIIVLREGFEAFLIVAIILAYLKKTGQAPLVPAVFWGILISIVASIALGFLMYRGAASGPLMEGWCALIAAILIAWLVIHMWKHAPTLKRDMEKQLTQQTEGRTTHAAFAGVFIFTTVMIAREGMETALLLMQIHSTQIVLGCFLGALAAGAMAVLWVRFSYLINLKHFFQVTAVYLLLFVVQVLMYSFHEFTEAGVFPNSEALHVASEPFSPDGLYGKWFSLGLVVLCSVWLLGAGLVDKFSPVSKRVQA
jgi:high-affinity iron transporter